MCRKMRCHGRRPAWLNRELWIEFRKKKRVYDLWKKGQANQEDYKDVMRLCTEKTRRAKAQLVFNLTTAVKDNKDTVKENKNKDNRKYFLCLKVVRPVVL